MKLYVRAPITENRLEELKEYFSEIVYDPWTKTGERFYEDAMLEALKQHKPDVLITELDRITEKVLKNVTGLRAIGDCRANPANIDVEACTRHGIPVLCTPARNAQAVAEMLVGLLVCFLRQVIPAVQWAKDGGWKPGTTPYYLWMGNELQGKKIGFVGFGAVGRAAAGLLKAFGCSIAYYDPYVRADSLEEGYEACELVRLFRECDIISLHLPVLESTKGMIGKELLGQMKETAVLVNTSRSAVVDNDALTGLLEAGKIRGAILDVLETEPPEEAGLRLAALPNVLLTPHICGATYEVTDHQSDIITERLKKWLAGEDLETVVYNRDVLKQ